MNRLKELRTEKGLTQQELADLVEVTKLTIANWENEKHKIKSDKAQQLADYFGVEVGYLLGYSNTDKNILAWETDLLSTIRKNQGYSIEDVSDVTGIPIETLKNLEKGTVGFSYQELNLLTHFFGVKVSDILGYTPSGKISIPLNISANIYSDVENITDIQTVDSLISDTLLANKLLDSLRDKLLSSKMINSEEYNNEIEKVMSWLIDFNNALGMQKLLLITKSKTDN